MLRLGATSLSWARPRAASDAGRAPVETDPFDQSPFPKLSESPRTLVVRGLFARWSNQFSRPKAGKSEEGKTMPDTPDDAKLDDPGILMAVLWAARLTGNHYLAEAAESALAALGIRVTFTASEGAALLATPEGERL
jgi:hypothetical protein